MKKILQILLMLVFLVPCCVFMQGSAFENSEGVHVNAHEVAKTFLSEKCSHTQNNCPVDVQYEKIAFVQGAKKQFISKQKSTPVAGVTVFDIEDGIAPTKHSFTRTNLHPFSQTKDWPIALARSHLM